MTCYPGTPSSEIPDTFHSIASCGRFRMEYSVNEKVAVEVAAGAALAGAMSMTTMKHVGVNVAADPLFTAAYVGLPGGFVLVSADDPLCHSSQNEQDNRTYARFMGMPCFEPATAQEAKDMARDALLLARELQQPVMLRTTTRVNHLRGPVTFGPLGEPAPVVPFERNPMRFVPVPAVAQARHKILVEHLENARAKAEASPWNKVSGEGRIGVVASGISRAYLADALNENGWEDQVKVLELGFTWPLPENLIADFLSGCDTVLVIEELQPLLEQDLRALAQERGISVNIVGKGPHLTLFGEYSTGAVARALAAVLGKEPLAASDASIDVSKLPGRPPNLCAGCSHRAVYYAVRKVFGDEAVYSSDIGCYTLGMVPPLRAADFLFPDGLVCLRRERFCDGFRPSRGRLHRRFHLLPFRHDGPRQRGLQQAQPAVGHPRQRHHGHDRPPAESGRLLRRARRRSRAFGHRERGARHRGDRCGQDSSPSTCAGPSRRLKR